MRKLLAIAMLHAVLGTGCGGCVDDEKGAKVQPPQGSSAGGPTGVRRMKSVGPIFFEDAGAPAANDP